MSADDEPHGITRADGAGAPYVGDGGISVDYDFYAGYEGEPELIVEHRLNGLRRATIRAWIGYFDELMAFVKPAPSGWTGIALPYHLATGWNDDAWVDPDPADSFDKVATASVKCDGLTRRFAEALMSVLREVMSEGGELVWRLE